MNTTCADCQHLSDSAKGTPFWRWMCTKHHRVVQDNYVTGDNQSPSVPMLLCKDVNAGHCPLFEPGRNCLNAENRDANE